MQTKRQQDIMSTQRRRTTQPAERHAKGDREAAMSMRSRPMNTPPKRIIIRWMRTSSRLLTCS
jgi:hypothetical protein